jgi:hypothetical protein
MTGFYLLAIGIALLAMIPLVPFTAGPLSDPRVVMRIAVSILLLGAALYIILSHAYDAQDKHWAYATAGTILGFWLRGSK